MRFRHLHVRWILPPLFFLLAACVAVQAAAPPLRVLIFSGQNNHDWKTTTPKLQSILADSGRFAVHVTDHPGQSTAETLAPYQLIVGNWNDWGDAKVKGWPPVARDAFLNFVRGGKGYVSIHAGSSSFYDWPEYQQIGGLSWNLPATSHGPPHEFHVQFVGDHPVTRGLAPFKTKDELWLKPGVHPAAHVIATAEGNTLAVTTALGSGRGFALLLGHSAEFMDTPGFQSLLVRGAEWAATGTVTARNAATRERPEPRMTFLENGEVRIGMDLALGGAVTFISSREHPANIINSADLGRQIQMSHYSGPWPFVFGEKKPRPDWAGLGWNPIQTGDCHMNPSKVVAHRNDGRELYVKCIPMQWPHDNVPGDCVFETWTTLEGPVIHMRFRCTNQRLDTTVYRPGAQELPAVYTISKLSRLMTYTGDSPFTGGALTHVTNDWHRPWPWTAFIATERWAALVNEENWGLGVFKDDGGEFHGGVHGDERSDDPKHSSTAYVAPIHREMFDHNIVYEHRTDFTVGTLEDIRLRFGQMASKTPPSWRFATDRQHWILRNAADLGLPFQGSWVIRLADEKPRLEGPTQCWRAEQVPAVELQIAFEGKATQARLFWKRLDADRFEVARSLAFDLVPSEEPRTYRLALSAHPEYRGLITGLALEPVLQPQPGGQVAIRSIVLAAVPASSGSRTNDPQ